MEFAGGELFKEKDNLEHLQLGRMHNLEQPGGTLYLVYFTDFLLSSLMLLHFSSHRFASKYSVGSKKMEGAIFKSRDRHNPSH